jgi:transcriptional regulator with XRE-family HTH domain
LTLAVKINPEQVRKALAVRGLDQKQLAALAGVTPQTISHAMHGRPVSATTLQSIAGALLRLPVLPGTEDLVAS